MVRKILLYLWQLPQNLLGLIVIVFTRAILLENEQCWYTSVSEFGVSLGHYIIFGKGFNHNDLQHERGHQTQSMYLGWLYLIVIGLPSFLGNIWDRLAHTKWQAVRRHKWYYAQPWEAWADRLGGVDRWWDIDMERSY